MLVQDFTYVDLPIASVRRGLTAGPDVWLTPLAVRAESDGETLRVRIGPVGDARLLSRTTRVSVGEPRECGDTLVIPMTWQADGMAAAFPVLWADLEVAPLGPCETQITLTGRYEPPLGAFGRGLDRLLLHHIVQASIRSFLEGVGAALEAELVHAAYRAEAG